MKKQKICIIGGSLTALTTAVSLSKLNCEIDLITGNYKTTPNPSRTIAISESNLDFLKKLSIFKSIKNEEFWPCSIMKLYSQKNNKDFSKIFEIDNKKKIKKILYMIKNNKLLELLIKKIKKTKSISIKKDQKIHEIENSGLLKSVKYENKYSKYHLVILCSGSNSELVKKYFGNEFIENLYNETSITTILKHEAIKNNIVRQFFLDDEILAFLPISNTHTSIVWTVKKNMYPKNDLHIKKKIKIYAKKYFNKIKFLTKIEYRNLNFLIRKKYYQDRILLFGDALHVIHPFVGQGFNMILRDLISLEKTLAKKINLGLDIGSPDILSEFMNETKPRNFAYSIGIDMIKNSFALKNNSTRKIRNNIFKTINKSDFAKDIFFDIADKGLKF